MSHYEKIKHVLKNIETREASELTADLTTVFEVFPLLSKDEKKECSENFYAWAKERSEQEPLKFAYANYLMAACGYFNEDFESATAYSIEAQRLLDELGDKNGSALCSGILGGIYRTLGNVDLALKSLWEGYEQLNKSGVYQHNLMACSYNLGFIYLELKHYDEALPFFKNIFETAEKLNNNLWINNGLQGLAKVYLAQKKYPEAKEAQEKALTAAEKSNHPMFISTAYTDMANYYYEVGDYKESKELHKKALGIREEHKFINGAITNCIRLAEINIKQSNTDEAISLLEKGLKLAEQINVKPKIYQIQLLLSEIYQSKKEFEKSLFHHQKFHEIREQVELEDAAKKVKNLQLVFEAEQTKKENIIIKKQKAEIEAKNIELQETIDELTRTKVGKKAKAFTLIIAIVLFLLEELIIHSVLHLISDNGFYISFIVKMVIILSLKPIDSAIEHYLLKKIIKKKKKEVLV